MHTDERRPRPAPPAARERPARGRATGKDCPPKGESQATTIAGLAAGWQLWHDPAGAAYATLPVGEHQETWSVRSQSFKLLLAKNFFEATGQAASSDALSTGINLVEAQAVHGAPEHPVYVRVAEHAGAVVVDLCDAAWRAVEITPSGWTVVDKPPVRFRRSAGMLALPVPQRGGSLELLRQLINVDPANFKLVAGWLIGALAPRGPYPVLFLIAVQGAGKSLAATFLHNLIDPNEGALSPEPRSTDDLMISAVKSWCLSFDNLSHLDARLSDALCRISTGAGYRKRALYTDSDQVILKATRPILLTSIVELAERPDLLDRSLLVNLMPLGDRRRDEKTLRAEYESLRPKILGALFDAVSMALAELPRVSLNQAPRLLDFTRWVTAAEPALGWPPGAFQTVYTANRAAANDLALEASPVANRLLKLLDERGQWEGSAAELLAELDAGFNDHKRPFGWPKAANSLSRHLSRLTPNLAAAGWHVHRAHSGSRLLTFLPVDDTHTPPDGLNSGSSMPTTAKNSPQDDSDDSDDTFATSQGDGQTSREQGEL